MASERHILNRGVLALTLMACAGIGDQHGGPSLRLDFGALDLPGTSDVCFALAVTNASGAVVMTRGPLATLADPARNPALGGWTNAANLQDSPAICSSRFGNGPGGAWSYVAPCDASEPLHTLTLWLETLHVTGQDPPLSAGVDYQDPCPTGCALTATCLENADTPVRFDVTVMRRAEQGFFDVAVSFQSIFCSAKVDCEGPDGQALELLHHPETGHRGPTVVVALACSAGPGAEPTVLLRDDLTITCHGQPWHIAPSGGEGNVYSGASPAPAGAPFWQVANYHGAEDLPCGQDSCQKVFWNSAIGLTLPTPDCTLTTSASAGPLSAIPALSTPAHATWPIIRFDVQLTDADGARTCGNHPLNGLDGAVETAYTPPSSPRTFAHRLCAGPCDGPLWTPAALSVALWLDASAAGSVVLESGGVSQWSDLSGNGHHATQPVVAARPTLAPDAAAGLPAVRFGGAATQHALNLPDFASALTEGEIFAVLWLETALPLSVSDTGLWSFGTYAANTHYPFTDGLTYLAWGRSVRFESTPNIVPLGAPHLLNVASATTWVLRQNSVTTHASSAGVVGFRANPRLGVSTSNNRFLDGYMAEIIMTDTVTDTATRQRIEGYLAHKWGFAEALPVGHPFRDNPPLTD